MECSDAEGAEKAFDAAVKLSPREAQNRILHAAIRNGIRAGDAKSVYLDRDTSWRERLTAV